ncbi:peptidase S8/S53 domain-containing protein [Syncephalis plumigaleata]|nr:peptidase S8/S53 domain-containing protein [Syncephalis plumigaleata]
MLINPLFTLLSLSINIHIHIVNPLLYTMKCHALSLLLPLLAGLAVTQVVAISPESRLDRTSEIKQALREQTSNGYIVKLKPGEQASNFIPKTRNSRSRKWDFQQLYNTTDFQGFATKLSPTEFKQLQADNRVEYVEPQGIVHVAVTQPNAPGWGLPRICHRERTNDNSYIYADAGGFGVDIWIIDTGIKDSLSEFGGRARQIGNYVRDEANTDLHGHGTRVAAILAKRSRIYSIKAMNQKGDGSTADVVSAIQYVTKVAKRGKTVLNLSFTGSNSRAIDDAVNAAADAGIAVIVAAGNESDDACNESPPAAAQAFAVAASDRNENHAYYSNYGKCTQLYAPGSDIRSIDLDGNSQLWSGTSMAAPFVAGTAAIFMSMYNFNSIEDLYNLLVNNATPNQLRGVKSDTSNRLLYSLR